MEHEDHEVLFFREIRLRDLYQYKDVSRERGQGFIQALTELRLPEVKTQSYKLSFETQSFKPKKQKSNKNCLDCMERALFILCAN